MRLLPHGSTILGLAALAGYALAGYALVGCGRTVSEADCTQIKDNMRAAWSAEAKKAALPEAVNADKATAVVRAEGDKLVSDWMAECKKELMGRRVEPKEMDCLLQAKTLADINKCSEP